MNIIVEGPDLTGKNTICDALGKRLNLIQVEPRHKHRIDFKDNPELYQIFVGGMNTVTSFMIEEMDGLIFNRLHLSEYVYSTYYGRKSYVKFEDFEESISKRSNEDTFLILINGDYGSYSSRYTEDEKFLCAREYESHCRLFEESFILSNIKNKFMFRSKDHTIDSLISSIMTSISKVKI